jgi:hypothetical protein
MTNNGTKNSYFQILLWGLYLILFPFQFFPPGSPQIADLVMLVGVFSFFFKKFTINNYIKSLSFFVIYTILIGVYYTVINFDFEFLKSPLNYLYCLASLIFVSQIADHSKFILFTSLGIFFSLLIQLYVFKTIGFNEEQFRFVLYFNNPNQLGLWALSLLVFISFMFQIIKVNIYSFLILIISFSLSIFYILLSISQAAIISASLIIVALSAYYSRLKWLFILFPLFIILYNLYYKEIYDSEAQILINLQNRIDNEITEDDGDNGLEGRNYTRLFRYPEYLFWGSGEGKVNRFGKDGLEIHSTFANVLFSYGIFGLVLFLLPYINFVRKKSFFLSIILGSYFIFTLVHNTIRWPLFWIVPYLMYIIPLSNSMENKKNE